jgi:hypothetical protein
MRRRRRLELALNLVTMTMLVVSLVIWARSTLGEGTDAGVRETTDRSQIPDSMGFEALASGDTFRLEPGAPALYLVFRSTCPACELNLRSWRGIISQLPEGVQAFAIALEGRASGLAYARRSLMEALGMRPLQEQRFVREFGIVGLPSTMLIDAAGVIRMRRSGVLDAKDVDDIVKLARQTALSR